MNNNDALICWWCQSRLGPWHWQQLRLHCTILGNFVGEVLPDVDVPVLGLFLHSDWQWRCLPTRYQGGQGRTGRGRGAQKSCSPGGGAWRIINTNSDYFRKYQHQKYQHWTWSNNTNSDYFWKYQHWTWSNNTNHFINTSINDSA